MVLMVPDTWAEPLPLNPDPAPSRPRPRLPAKSPFAGRRGRASARRAHGAAAEPPAAEAARRADVHPRPGDVPGADEPGPLGKGGAPSFGSRAGVPVPWRGGAANGPRALGGCSWARARRKVALVGVPQRPIQDWGFPRTGVTREAALALDPAPLRAGGARHERGV